MAAAFLDIRRDDVQDFLWAHLVPSDIACGISKADAFRFVVDELMRGSQWLIGDLDRGVAFRVWMRNPKVIEPHVMGDALHLRGVMQDCLPLAWERGVEKVMVWTQHQALGRIVERLGFTREAFFPRTHLVGDTLLDLSVYSLERPQ